MAARRRSESLSGGLLRMPFWQRHCEVLRYCEVVEAAGPARILCVTPSHGYEAGRRGGTGRWARLSFAIPVAHEACCSQADSREKNGTGSGAQERSVDSLLFVAVQSAERFDLESKSPPASRVNFAREILRIYFARRCGGCSLKSCKELGCALID